MKQIREMTPDERNRRMDELKTELSKLKTMINAGGSIENAGRVHELRKTIARIMTVNREVQITA
jgi:large subunit ribosomal protein L29